MDLLGVEPEYIRRSEYKSAPEQFMRHESSQASQEQNKKLMDDLYGLFVKKIEEGRKIKRKKVRSIIDNAPYTAQEAKKLKLVDGLLYPDQFEDTLEEQFKDSKVQPYGENTITDIWDALPEIAVIYVDGAIVTGESQSPGLLSGQKLCGSRTIVAQLEKARSRSQVKGVVLRIDSPGGSSFASEEIWRAIEKFKNEEKPLVVSMGGVAASGGYYIAAGADTIFAESSTITGSIGVFAAKFNFQKVYELLGINVEFETRGKNAGYQTPSRRWTPTERRKMEHLIDSTYETFKKRVADGRGLKPEEVESLAKGRVWSGKEAKKRKLVDKIGGFYDAIEDAKEQAGIKKGTKVNLIRFKGGNRRESPFTSLIGELRTISQPPSLQDLLPPDSIRNELVWTMMPYQIQIK